MELEPAIEEHCSLASLLLLFVLLAACRAFIVTARSPQSLWGHEVGTGACDAQLGSWISLQFTSDAETTASNRTHELSGVCSLVVLERLETSTGALQHETSGMPTCLVSAQTLSDQA